MRRAIARLDATVHAIIQARRQSGDDRGDLLSILQQAQDQDDGSGMTDAQVRDEVMTLLLAGHENTANALSWSLYLLTQQADVYAQIRAEVDQTLAGRPVTYTVFLHLKCYWAWHGSLNRYCYWGDHAG